MRIKVIKANKKSYWYSNNIGEIFDAEVASQEQQDEYDVAYVIGDESSGKPCRFFDGGDVEVVGDELAVVVSKSKLAEEILKLLRYAVTKAHEEGHNEFESDGRTGYSDSVELAGILGMIERNSIGGLVFICPDCGYKVQKEELFNFD